MRILRKLCFSLLDLLYINYCAFRRRNSKLRIMISPLQCRLARAALNWTIADLAKAARVAPNSISKFENDQGKTHYSTKLAIERACIDAGIIFIDNGQEGVAIKK